MAKNTFEDYALANAAIKAMRADMLIRKPSSVIKTLGAALIITVYFTLKPIYLNSSGTLQISDIILIIFLFFYFIHNRFRFALRRKSQKLIIGFFVLVVYQAVINMIWSLRTGDVYMNRRTLYYVFNLIAFSSSVLIGEKVGSERLKKAMAFGSLYGLIFTCIGMLVYSGGSRNTGFFNNPNQLGYYAVLMLTVLVVCRNQYSRVQRSVVFIISAWAAIVSLSKAAVIAFFAELVVVVLSYQKNRSAKRLVFVLFLILLLAMSVYLLLYADVSFVNNNITLRRLRYRILYMTSENDSGLAYGRGYARIFEVFPHILWGTGEGAYWRFVAKHNTEVHSTLISLLTCYGLIGITGYFKIFVRCMGRNKNQIKKSCVFLFGVFMYSLTHNGIRNTLLWMILALLLCINEENEKT